MVGNTYGCIAVKCSTVLLKCTVYHNADFSHCSAREERSLSEYQEMQGHPLHCILLTTHPHDASWWLDFVWTHEYQKSIASSFSVSLICSSMTDSFISFRFLLKSHFLMEGFLDDFIWNLSSLILEVPASILFLLSIITISHTVYLHVCLV